jgi:hypothetical protein
MLACCDFERSMLIVTWLVDCEFPGSGDAIMQLRACQRGDSVRLEVLDNRYHLGNIQPHLPSPSSRLT